MVISVEEPGARSMPLELKGDHDLAACHVHERVGREQRVARSGPGEDHVAAFTQAIDIADAFVRHGDVLDLVGLGAEAFALGSHGQRHDLEVRRWLAVWVKHAAADRGFGNSCGLGQQQDNAERGRGHRGAPDGNDITAPQTVMAGQYTRSIAVLLCLAAAPSATSAQDADFRRLGADCGAGMGARWRCAGDLCDRTDHRSSQGVGSGRRPGTTD